MAPERQTSQPAEKTLPEEKMKTTLPEEKKLLEPQMETTTIGQCSDVADTERPRCGISAEGPGGADASDEQEPPSGERRASDHSASSKHRLSSMAAPIASVL